ncbi:Hsp20/alpha crystallin family protein [Promicromonospora citrea]|uniref:Heat-shock protein Hsp20 n=1 Tax=Promicromonospora citrea TaxID=43677 RepID=A0A8H9GKW9_9MICO|nr:Hsp20/alpha crystallin family protein [Promicromonospora citrea]NNH55022.1 Hsp20/alpha crystallin family protein [Promicromonospora citrea]GGM32550.1 heat-shock protein Hsp20 [Promicromonospora citrea]
MATYWDPFQEMDRLFASIVGNVRQSGAPPMDLFRTGDHYVLSMDLPGVDPGTIDVSVEDRTLTVRAERTQRSGDDAQWLVRERPTGTFARQLTLGRGLALDQVSASYADGVLSLTIPVSEEARPRRIEVAHAAGGTAVGRRADERQAIEA